MSRSPFPDPAVAHGWHESLLAGDPVAPAMICNAYLEPLLAHLRRRYSQDDHLIEEAVHSALTEYVKYPHRFDPAINPDLGVYLRMAAVGDLHNLLSKESRRNRNRKVVELDALAGNDSWSEGPLLRLIRDEEAEALERFVAEIDLTQRDQSIIRLVLAGEKATVIYATAMGIADLPLAEQEAEVKRAKDRIKKRLRRFRYHA